MIKYNLSKKPGEEPLDLFDTKYQMDMTAQKVLDTNGELPAVEYDSLFNNDKSKFFAGSPN